MSQLLPDNSNVPTVKSAYSSEPQRHASRLPICSSQPNIVAASSCQLQHSTNEISLQQPNTTTFQRNAHQFRPKGHYCSVFQSTSTFDQWHQPTTPNLHAIHAVCHLVSTIWKLSQSFPLSFKAPTIEQLNHPAAADIDNIPADCHSVPHSQTQLPPVNFIVPQKNQPTAAKLHDNTADCPPIPANRIMSKLLPVNFNVPPVKSASSSQAMRHHSGLPLRFGQPNSVGASCIQLQCFTSEISLQQPTSMTSKQTAHQFRSTGFFRTLLQSNSPFHQ